MKKLVNFYIFIKRYSIWESNLRRKSRFARARLRSRTKPKRKKKIELMLEKIDKSSTLSTDDQLFFGFVFTLLIFFLELPESFDFSSIFTGLGINVAPSSALINAKWVLISFLLFSSICRYLTTFTNKNMTKNTLRVASVSFLLGCPYFIIADWTIRPLSSVLSEINPYFLVLAPLVLIGASVLIGQFVEKRWNKIYGQEKAPTSFAFSYVGLSLAVTYYVALTTSIFVPLSYFHNVMIMAGSFAFTFFLLKVLQSRAEKTKKNGKK
jgi:hypothetical protein